MHSQGTSAPRVPRPGRELHPAARRVARAAPLVIACGAMLLALPVGAVVTATWGVETYPQWDAGDATAAFITSAGELRPGWDTKRTALEGDAVWSSLHLPDGSVLVGSDVGGAIYKDGKKLVSVP